MGPDEFRVGRGVSGEKNSFYGIGVCFVLMTEGEARMRTNMKMHSGLME